MIKKINELLPFTKDVMVTKILKLYESEDINTYTAKELIKRTARDERIKWADEKNEQEEEKPYNPLEDLIRAFNNN